MTEAGARRQKWVVCALLAGAVLIVFWSALQCLFVGLDDPDYVVENTNIQHGLNWKTVRWSFTTGHAANWHPLTWLSHTVDCQIYGLRPAGHHLTNLLLHLCSTILLFLLLNRITGQLWRSAWVTAIFALHPLRVESVVWISERKDVLSTFFWMLTVWAYVRYVEEFKVQSSKFKMFYALALVLFACALMSKPMVVTLPCVLLLLDFWPLRRLELGPRLNWRLIAEKIPFVFLAIAAAATTYLVQSHSGVVAPLSKIPLADRLANVPVAYVRYLGMIFWPSGLAVFYGRAHWSFFQVGGAFVLLGTITVFVLQQIRTRPYLAMGWFWFLGILVPVIGLVVSGNQALADRFTYVSGIGIAIMVAWGVGDLAASRPVLLKSATAVAALTVAICAVLTPRQIVYWRSLVSLYARAADVSDQDYETCFSMGTNALAQADFPRAVRCFERALKAADQNVAKSSLAETKNDLGCALLEQGQISGAISNFEDALALDPNVAEIHYHLAGALAQFGRYADAITQYSQALQLRPTQDEAANGLAWLLATCPDRSLRNGAKAVALARQASLHAQYLNPAFLGTLAAAYAEIGNFAEASATAERAYQLALDQNKTALAGVLESQLRQYQNGGGASR